MLVEQLFNQVQWERTLSDRQTDIDADRQADKKGVRACGGENFEYKEFRYIVYA